VNPKPHLRVVQVFGIEEPASVVFSAVAIVAVLWSWCRHIAERRRHPRRIWATFPYRCVWHACAPSVLLASLTSVLFHAHETKLTERADYIAAMSLIVVFLASAVIRVAQLRRRAAQAAVYLAAAAVVVAHSFYMLFVRFHYGWQFRLGTYLSAAMVLLWVAWSLVELRAGRTPQARWVLASVLAVAVFAPLELGDFRPYWGIFDGHSLWHASLTLMTSLYWEFCIQDLRAWAKSSRSQSQSQKGDPTKRKTKAN
jgi:hypothetical protein